ncbi:MAG: (deoxy)nucleoside triphosphate pyrophosphohydrolase [Desulfuromonadales bacterium]
MTMSKRHVHVACAVVERDGLILAAQRSANTSLPLKWEFPGGKLEEGESPEECLKREMFEEMGVGIAISDALNLHTHSYPDFTVTLYPFRCSLEPGEITLHEHAALCWLPPEQLHELDWAEADLSVINDYRTRVQLP